MQQLSRWQRSLSAQMVGTLIALLLLTALAIGLPALLIIRNQLERQAWGLVNQGNQTAHAILANRQSNLTNLAILSAQRPTLQRLAAQDAQPELGPYLQTLQQGAGLDLVALCDAQDRIVAQTGDRAGGEICAQADAFAPYIEAASTGARAWLLAAQPLPGQPAATRVVVGVAIDDAFARDLSRETGMQHVLLFNGEYGASSFAAGRTLWNEQGSPAAAQGQAGSAGFTLVQDDDTYQAIRTPYAAGLEVVVAHPISDLLRLRRQLSWSVGAGMLGVILLISAVGIARSRRISGPLETLRDAAEKLRAGQFDQPVQVDTPIRELALLSFALDDARIALHYNLTQLRREKAWTEHILESVVEGIVTMDRWGRITFFSRGAEQITGWRQAEVLGRSIDRVFPLADRDEDFSQRLPRPGAKQKVAVRTRHDRLATLAVTGARLVPPDSEREEVVLVLSDVTNEEAIRRLLGEFLANITHEFRTPLSALAASIELLLNQLGDLQEHELKELLDNIHLGTLSLQQLIDNLLEGASIETGRFQVSARASSPIEIVEEALRILHPLAEKYTLTLDKDWPADLPPVHADFRRTTQVMVNLLSNAVKWGPAGSAITVKITPLDECLEISVLDRGPGIPPEILPDIFHRYSFNRGEAHPGQGVGLGLSVVKAIVEAQGGQVGARNRPDGGADFWFSLRYTARVDGAR